MGWIPGWGIKILHATGSAREKEKYVVFFRHNVIAATQKEKKINMLYFLEAKRKKINILYFLDISLLHT